MPPDHATLYAALLRRDSSLDGTVFVAVSSTGIFCRLTCPARKPKPENCAFLPSVAACLDAGYRPCLRCHPMAAPDDEPTVARLMTALDAAPQRRWSEADLVALGLDPSTVRRAFHRHFGCTFLEMARRLRLRAGLETLAEGQPVIEAQLDAGFDSPAAFRAAFARLLGVAPGSFRKDARLRADWIDTPLGAMVAVADDTAVHLLEFVGRKALPAELKRLALEHGCIGLGRPAPTVQAASELEAFFAGRCSRFVTLLAPQGSPFAQSVWRALRTIPAGQTCSYSEIAAAIGRPEAVRAVARANGANPIAVLIPCHRVIGSDGALTGYGGGLWRKRKLIALETAYAERETA